MVFGFVKEFLVNGFERQFTEWGKLDFLEWRKTLQKKNRKKDERWVRNISLWFYVLSYTICIRTNNVQQLIDDGRSRGPSQISGIWNTTPAQDITHQRCGSVLYLRQLPVQSLKLAELPGDGPAVVLAAVIFRKAHSDKVISHLLSILLRGLRDTHTDFNIVTFTHSDSRCAVIKIK